MTRARILAMFALLMAAGAHAQQTDSEREHVAPDPPRSHVGHDMSYREMAEMMGMDDRARFLSVRLPRLEWIDADETTFAWEGALSYGGDVNKLLLGTEGDRVGGDTHDARTELLWDRIVSRWWSAQVGVRHDTGVGPSREWFAFGVHGLAPGRIELSATAYIGDSGRTAARLAAEYELLITQRLVLEPGIELDIYGEDDPAREIESGVSELELGLRLRYEFRRELAPYVGVLWSRKSGGADDISFVAGLRIWR